MLKHLKHIPALILAAFLIMMGVQKFGSENIIFATIAEKSNIPIFEPVIRIFTGLAELAAAALLLWPDTRCLGAFSAIAIIGGALAFHLSPWLGISVAMAPNVEPTTTLFVMALGAFVLSLVVAAIAIKQSRARRAAPEI